MQSSLVDTDGPLVAREQVYFDLTKEEKVARIARVGCDVFVDDLPEILLAETFPPDTLRILFDPEGHHASVREVRTFRTWAEILEHVRGS